MKFLVPNYSCLQNPWLGGYHPQIPVLSSVLNWIYWTPPPEKNSWVRHCIYLDPLRSKIFATDTDTKQAVRVLYFIQYSNMRIQVFWCMTMCCWVSGYRCFKRLWCLHLQESNTLLRWTHYISWKCWEMFTQWRSVTSQKTHTLGNTAVSGFCDKLTGTFSSSAAARLQQTPSPENTRRPWLAWTWSVCTGCRSFVGCTIISSWPMRTGYCYTGPLLYSKTIICHFLLLIHCACAQLAEWTMLMQ